MSLAVVAPVPIVQVIPVSTPFFWTVKVLVKLASLVAMETYKFLIVVATGMTFCVPIELDVPQVSLAT